MIKSQFTIILAISFLFINTLQGQNKITTQEYIQKYQGIAQRQMQNYGIPASIIMAQALLESGTGNSTLAVKANNHFGIKCHRDWKGPAIRHHDDKRNECFRKYRRPEESFTDHTEFLKSGSRYSFLFSLDQTDYKGWARGLKKAGYATNPDYANMLIRKIEEHNLHYYDMVNYTSEKSTPPVKTDEVPGVKNTKTTSGKISDIAQVTARDINPFNIGEEKISTSDSERVIIPQVKLQENIVVSLPVRIMQKNRIQYIIVRDGDTKESIENEFNLLKWELAKYNDLNQDFKLSPGQILYIQPKRDKAEQGDYFYFSVEGDTMYSISQKFGIKLRKLYEMNRMKEGSDPVVNQKIWLRTIKPVNQRQQ